MPLTFDQQYQQLANEARKKELRVQISRLGGQMDASSALARYVSGVNQDTALQKQQLEQQLKTLEEGGATGTLDDWGKFSTIEAAMQTERFHGKDKAYDWLVLHSECTLEELAEAFGGFMLEKRAELGRPWILQNPRGLLMEWQRQAYERHLIQEDSWTVFRAFLLHIGKEQATSMM